MKIAFIGYGEAAHSISLSLKKKNISEILAYDELAGHPKFQTKLKNKAKSAHVKLVSDIEQAVAPADIVFAAVPAANAIEASRSAVPYLRNAQIYVDISDSIPAVKDEIANELWGTNALFVDAAVLGSLSDDMERTTFLVDGTGAVVFKNAMEPYGLHIKVASDLPITASAVKIIRNVYVKGLAALMIETMQAADAYGVTDEIIDSIDCTFRDRSFSEQLDLIVGLAAGNCARWADELKGSVAMLANESICTDMTAAAKLRLEELIPYRQEIMDKRKKKPNWQEVIDAIRIED